MPTLHDLPNELLLEILSYLDNHLDVRDCSQATKVLRAVAYHPSLDHKLFHSKSVKNKHDIIDMDTFALHPIFSWSMLNKEMLLPEDPYIVLPECDDKFDQAHGLSVLLTQAVLENATSPLVSCINFDGLVIKTKNNNAVTTGQVSKELVRRNVEKKHDNSVGYHYDSTHVVGGTIRMVGERK